MRYSIWIVSLVTSNDRQMNDETEEEKKKISMYEKRNKKENNQASLMYAQLILGFISVC